ncbi:MAG: hypothetical protein ACYC8S_03425 [Minisyncoccota bacterium]
MDTYKHAVMRSKNRILFAIVPAILAVVAVILRIKYNDHQSIDDQTVLVFGLLPAVIYGMELILKKKLVFNGYNSLAILILLSMVQRQLSLQGTPGGLGDIGGGFEALGIAAGVLILAVELCVSLFIKRKL